MYPVVDQSVPLAVVSGKGCTRPPVLRGEGGEGGGGRGGGGRGGGGRGGGGGGGGGGQ